MSGKLYIVGLPIGNAGDMTGRAREILGTADIILAENPDRAKPLLAGYGIADAGRTVKYHEKNDAENRALVRSIQAGETAALISDAGMPLISDPGARLVRLLADTGVEIDVAPGASAVLASLAVSGINCARFCFEGFLSTAVEARRTHLESLRDERRAMVFFETPKKLPATLKSFAGVFEGGRRLAICCNLTKADASVWRGTIAEAVEIFANDSPKGELVLVIAGKIDKK